MPDLDLPAELAEGSPGLLWASLPASSLRFLPATHLGRSAVSPLETHGKRSMTPDISKGPTFIEQTYRHPKLMCGTVVQHMTLGPSW